MIKLKNLLSELNVVQPNTCYGVRADNSRIYFKIDNGVVNAEDENLIELVISNPLIEELNCYWNQLTNLDISKLINLKFLDCTGNNLTEIDITNCPLLTEFNMDLDDGVKIINKRNHKR